MMRSLLHLLLSESRLPWVAALLACLLAAWVIVQGQGINSDALLYMEVAELFGRGEWTQGLQVYNWPLYPLLMLLVDKLTGVGLLWSAHGLAMLFFALTTAGLLVLAREVGGDRRTMLAAMLLLFVSPYMVESVLPMVVREHGFWAAHIWSLVHFVRFHKIPAAKSALAWGGFALVAMLFRIEAVTYLLLLPFVLLLQSGASPVDRVRNLLKAHAVALATGLAIVLILIAIPELTLSRIGRLRDPYNVLVMAYQQLTAGLSGKAEIFENQVLGSYLSGFAFPGLLLTLASVILVKAASSAGWLQFGLAAYAVMHKDRARPQFGSIFSALLVLGLLNAVVIILTVFLLPKRYVLPIGIVVIVYAAFALVALYEASQRVKGWGFPVLASAKGLFVCGVIAALVQGGDVLLKSNAKATYEQDAVQWMMRNTAVGSKVFYSTPRLRYYATGQATRLGRFNNSEWPEIYRLVSSSEVRQYDYLLIHTTRKKPEQRRTIEERLGAEPVMVFDNGRNDQVLIYSTRPRPSP